jgi:hypothetical protein
MSEYLNNDIQLIQPGAPIPLRTSIGCPNGYVYHRPESGILILRGKTSNCFARYQVTFNGNIAVPEGGTVGAIAIALTVDGEPIPTSRAIVTPAAVDEYFNVTSTAIITVPRGCCVNVSVENVSESTGTTPAPAINVQNSNLTVTRIA